MADYVSGFSVSSSTSSLEAAIDRCNALRYDMNYRRYLGDEFVRGLEGWLFEIGKRKNDPFTLAVIGDFKRGKSTLINALLGEETVTTDVTTETVTLNKIVHGKHTNEACLASGKRVRLEDSELKREHLESVLETLGEPVAFLELRREHEMLKNVRIIDTPGMGDALNDFAELVRDSLLEADAVVYVFNVRYPLSLSEQLFLRSAVLNQHYTALFLVGNQADMLRNETELERLRALIEERIQNLLPSASFKMVSALDELSICLGKEGEADEAVAPIVRSEFAALRAELSNLVEMRADNVIPDRMQRLALAMVNDLSVILDTVDQGLNMSEEDAIAALEATRQMMASVSERRDETVEHALSQIERMKDEAKVWMADFLGRIEQETLNLSSTDGEVLRRYYEVYCIDLMQEAMSACVEIHQDELYDLLDAISSDLGLGIAAKMEDVPANSFRFHIDNRIWTKGDTVGLAVSFVRFSSVLGAVASLVADGIAGGMRQQEARKRTPETLALIKKQLPTLAGSVNSAIDKMYDAMAKNARGLINDYFDDELLRREQLVNRAVEVSRKEAGEKEEIRQALKLARTILDDVKSACIALQ